jgi:CheY-like chemotaxis protein
VVVSHQIVSSHGGELGVVSSGIPGEGSVFFIELDGIVSPKSVASYSRRIFSGLSSVSNHIISPADDCRKLRVLVTDDSDLNRKMTCRALQTLANIDIDQAVDGDEAVTKVMTAMEEGKTYDVIFMDNIMPRLSGVEATIAIRALGFTNRIVGLTGSLLSEDIREFEAAGANKVLGKPFRFESVHAIFNGESM